MLGKTHLGSGFLASIILCDTVVGGTLLTLGSILPDIDHQNSLIGKNIPIIPKLFKHRGFTHSLLFVGMSYIIVNEWLALGILIHIFLDLMTKNGVKLIYPFKQIVRFPLAKYVLTNGVFEKILFIIIYLCIVYLTFNRFL